MASTSSGPSFSPDHRRRSVAHGPPSFNVVYNMPTINYFQPQHLIIPNFLHPIVTFIIPVILSLIELRCQCKPNSPFETNPKTTWFGISCLLAYCLAYGFELRFSSHLHFLKSYERTMIRYGSLLFASLCLASLTSILLPSMKLFLFAFYGLLSIGDILQRYKIVWKWIYEWILANFFRPSQGQQGDILPV